MTLEDHKVCMWRIKHSTKLTFSVLSILLMRQLAARGEMDRLRLMTTSDSSFVSRCHARSVARATGRIPSSYLRWAMLVSLTDRHTPRVHAEPGRRTACFLSAIQMVAGQTGKTDMARNAVIHTQVHLGKPNGMDGFGLEVEVQVEGIDDQALIDAGHAVSG